MDASIIVETYNYSEEPDAQLLRETVRAAVAIQREEPLRCEVLLADICGTPEILALLEEFPEVRRIDTGNVPYDAAKHFSAELARGEYLLFLDGDCVPHAGWFDHHLNALKGGADGTSGFTRYSGGFLSSISTVLDFGFLFPLARRALACYSSNNCAFRRSTFLAHPAPLGVLRCNCYAHTQLLIRQKKVVFFVPEARVLHHPQPFFPERFRQGRDAVNACIVNPALRERPWLKAGIFAAPLFYMEAVALDWMRMVHGYRDLGVSVWLLPIAMLLLPVFRLVDLAGMATALFGLPSLAEPVSCDVK
jgi:glycosyltransferase involved in cell wall biosynthesis